MTAYDIANQILSHTSHYAVGIVRRVEGAGSTVIGSGVLVSIDGRRGILTAGHVAEAYEKLPEIGLVRFLEGTQQRLVIPMQDTQTIILASSDSFEDGKEVLDLAFTMLPPTIISSIDAQGGVFLNIEKNKTRCEAPPPDEGSHCDAALGLVAEFSDEPFIDGKEWISPMRAILHTGHVCDQKNGLLTVDAMEYNLAQLPKTFGGMSGGGLWRTYFIDDEKGPRIINITLVGIVSWEERDLKKIICQGWDRIDQTLVPKVRETLK